MSPLGVTIHLLTPSGHSRGMDVVTHHVEHSETPHMVEPLEPHTLTVPVLCLPLCTSMLQEHGCTLC